VVAGEEHRLAIAVDAIAEIDHGMIEHQRRHRGASPTLTGSPMFSVTYSMRPHLGFAHREIAVLQLHFHDLVDAAPGNDVEAAVDTHRVAGNVERREEWQALDVVPVRVGDEDVGLHRQLLQQLLRQRKYAGAGIENDQGIVIAADFDAGGVATVAHGVRARRGNRATHAPESNFHAVPFISRALPGRTSWRRR
jgi:hypothetical protein